jgi:hypothetical protein
MDHRVNVTHSRSRAQPHLCEDRVVAYNVDAVTRWTRTRDHAFKRVRARGVNPVLDLQPPGSPARTMPALARHSSSSSILSMVTTASSDTAVSDSSGEALTRKRPSPAQLDALQTTFEDKPYLTRGERVALAEATGMCAYFYVFRVHNADHRR